LPNREERIITRKAILSQKEKTIQVALRDKGRKKINDSWGEKKKPPRGGPKGWEKQVGLGVLRVLEKGISD